MINLGQAVGYLMLDTTGFKAGFATAQSSLKQFTDSSTGVETKLKGLGTAATAAGATMTKSLTLPLVGIGTAAVKVTADFDAQMSKVAAISGATGEDFDKLREKAREMGAQTTFSASEAAEAFEYMAMAGWKTEDMMSGIEGIMNLAAAAGEDLGTTSDIVTDALTAFGLAAQDSAQFADILAAASSNANTNVSMMGESFKYAAPVVGSLFKDAAGGAEQAARDTALALGLMANSGIKASQAGTALRGILSRMAKPTEDIAQAMETLGVRLDDGEGHMYSLREIMGQLREGFGQIKMPVEEFEAAMAELDAQFEAGSITETEYAEAQDALMERAYGAEGALKAQTAAALGGRNAMSGLLAIVNATDEDYQKLTKSIDNASQVFVKTTDGAIIPMTEAMEKGLDWVEEYNGETERMAAVMRDNLSGQLTILKSQLQELAISIGTALMPTIRKIVEVIQGWVDKLNSMDESQRNLIIRIAGIVAALGPALLILGKVFTAVSSIINVIKVVSTALKALWALMLANPVTLIIAAIAALVAAFVYLWNHSEKFREFWINLWEKLKEAVQKIVDRIKLDFEILKLAIQLVSSWFHDKIEAIKQTFSNLKAAAQETWENIKTTISQKAQEIINKIANFGTSLYNGAKTAFSKFKTGAVERWNEIRTWFTERLTGLIDLIKQKYESFKNAGRNLLINFKNGLIEVFNEIKTWVQEKVDWLRNKWDSIKNFASNLGPVGSYATGTDYIFSDRVIQVHEGEAILSKEENQARKNSSFSGGVTIPVTFNITETIDGMTLAKHQHKYNMIVDNNHGISLIKA